MSRVVEVTLQMELYEGTHFNGLEDDFTDVQAINDAIFRFKEIIATLDDDGELDDYIQAKIVDEPS
jgi:hypothetical protein